MTTLSIKFTPAQRSAIDAWLTARGLTLERPTDILHAVIAAALTADGVAYPQDTPPHGGRRKGAGRKAKRRD